MKNESHITRGQHKKGFFAVFVIALPFAFLVLLESLLRLAGYGGNLDLVVRKTIGRKELFVINRSVAHRYFARGGVVVPEPADDTFSVVKSPGTRRIFCIGESTMAGFPYEFSATAPGFLRERLRMMYPDNTIEVVNVGLAAVGSFVVEDFIGELIPYEPDLFIVYVGHNEFYGAYGIGSKVTVHGGRWLTHLTISLLHFKTFLVLRDMLGWISSLLSSPAVTGNATLMGQMASEKEIPLGSPAYATARSTYRDNLAGIIEIAQRHGIPIVISSLVSNIKDLPPFVPLFDESTTEQKKRVWQDHVVLGDSAFSAHRYSEAIHEYLMAIALDSVNAEAYYLLGSAFYAEGRYDEAQRAFVHAKDLDALRFRAAEDFAEDLQQTCLSFHVSLAPVDSMFRAASPHGIIGNELILEHVHPNIQGYFLMAAAWSRTIADRKLLGPAPSSSISDSVVMSRSMVSAFDSNYGRIKIDLLTHRWPFALSTVPHRYIPTNAMETLIYQYVEGKASWSDTRYALAELFARQGRFDLARRECLAVANVIPFSYQPLLRVADYFREEGNTEAASNAYARCIETEDNPYARMKLAIILLEQDRPGEAEEQIHRAFEVKEYALPAPAAASARYLLGVALAKQGTIGEARRELEHALILNPAHKEAHELLHQLRPRE